MKMPLTEFNARTYRVQTRALLQYESLQSKCILIGFLNRLANNKSIRDDWTRAPLYLQLEDSAETKISLIGSFKHEPTLLFYLVTL